MSIIKTNQLMCIRETSIYSEKRKYSLCGQNLEFLNVARGGEWSTGSCHWAVNVSGRPTVPAFE